MDGCCFMSIAFTTEVGDGWIVICSGEKKIPICEAVARWNSPDMDGPFFICCGWEALLVYLPP